MARSEKPTYYIDSCVLIDLIGHDEGTEPAKLISELITSAENGQCRLITSTITIIEVLKGAHEKDMNVFDSDVQSRIDNLWHPGSSPIEVLEAHELIMREAADTYRRLFRDNGWGRARGPDMVHLVTAKREGASKFFTTETGLANYEPEFGFTICEPHLPPPPASGEHTVSPDLFDIVGAEMAGDGESSQGESE